MFRYLVQLLDPSGVVAAEHFGLFRHDDAAIEHAGWIDHPQGLRVWRSGRLVAEFPPVRTRAPFDRPGVSAGDLRLLRAAMLAVGRQLEQAVEPRR